MHYFTLAQPHRAASVAKNSLSCRNVFSLFSHNKHQFRTVTHCTPLNFSSAATVLNSVQPQLQTNAQTVFQPPAAPMQPVQAAVQQLMSQPTQGTNAQVTAAQVAAAQATSATTTVSQSNISVAALQTAGLSINPAIVRMPPQRFTRVVSSVLLTSGS